MIFSLKRQFWEGLLIAALGAAILVLIPSQIRVFAGLETALSPAFLPTLIGIGLLIVGFLIIVVSLFAKTQNAKEINISGKALKKIILAAIILFLYAFLFPIVGFLTTSFIFIGILSFLCGQRNFVKILILMLLIPAIVWMMFELLFSIPLPYGWLI